MGTVREVLRDKGRTVATIARERTVLEAARIMNDRRIGALVVSDAGEVVGIFTERDILTRVVAAQRDPAKTRVAEVMTSPVCFCEPDTPLEDCRAVFTSRRIRHLPVVSRRQLVGIVTSGDLLAYDSEERENTIHSLVEYIHGPGVSVGVPSSAPPSSSTLPVAELDLAVNR